MDPKPPPAAAAGPRRLPPGPALGLGAVALVAVAGWIGIRLVEREVAGNLATELRSTNDASVAGLRIWWEQKKADTASWAGDPAIRRRIAALMRTARQPAAGPATLLASPELAELRRRLGPVCRQHGYIGFVVFDPAGRQVGALLDEPVGRPLPGPLRPYLDRARAGQVVVTHPYVATVDLPDPAGAAAAGRPTMFALAPVAAEEAAVVAAVLGFRIRPEQEFSRVLGTSRFGTTGETYAFDAAGLLLSASRFDTELRAAGLLPDRAGSRAILALRIADPGRRLGEGSRIPGPSSDWPLTRMAREAVTGGSGVDPGGYRGYRGVPVVGAWAWLPGYGVGIATEMDAGEAYASRRVLRRVFLGLFLLLVALAAAWAWGCGCTRRAEGALAEERGRFAQVFGSSPDPVVIADGRGRVVECNRAFERVFGYGRADLVGGPLDPIIPEKHRAAHRAGIRRVTATGKERFTALSGAELTAVCKDGREIRVELTASTFRWAGDLHFAGVLRDITERKRVENELRRARDQAEAAARAKAEFLANTSHEIRTPLNAVIAMTELVLDTELSGDQRDCLETVARSGDALLAVIDDILDFSKIEAGKLELERRPFDPIDCVEDALATVACRAAKGGPELTACRAGETVPRAVVGDPARLRQVLLNLLGNAVKFTARGEVGVSVEARQSGSDSWELHFAVRDSGIGISAEERDRLFQAFTQADASVTRKYGGTGLGLAISARLVALMGGRIWVESEVGRGSTFHFTVLAGAVPGAAARPAPSGAPALAGRRILVVEDSRTDRATLARTLSSWAMAAYPVASGVEALAWIDRHPPPDVALVGLDLPAMDGLTLAREIRSRPGCAALPLVLMKPARAGASTAEGIFAAVLLRPLRRRQLQEALTRVVGGGTAQVRHPDRGRIDRDLGDRHPLRILVAEDNAVNRKVAEHLLRRLGYEPHIVRDGVEAVAALAERGYDVVLMDVQMPELDGLEATRRIRRRSGSQPWIIALTASALDAEREQCFAAGMDAFLPKPLQVQDLTRALVEAAEALARPSARPS